MWHDDEWPLRNAQVPVGWARAEKEKEKEKIMQLGELLLRRIRLYLSLGAAGFTRSCESLKG